MSLGKYPAASLAFSRERHIEARKLLATGTYPMALRKAAKTAEKVADQNSFATIANQWFEHWKDGKSSRHVNSTRRRLDTNIFPSLGPLQTAQIKAPDVVAMVRVIEARGAHDIAKRAMGTTGLIFRYDIAHGYAKRNPTGDFHPSDVLRAARTINYARIEAKEPPHLLRQIEVYPGTHVTRLAIKLVALTFVRTSELI
jgi:integrase